MLPDAVDCCMLAGLIKVQNNPPILLVSVHGKLMEIHAFIRNNKFEFFFLEIVSLPMILSMNTNNCAIIFKNRLNLPSYWFFGGHPICVLLNTTWTIWCEASVLVMQL
jgi:hypothetical protein